MATNEIYMAIAEEAARGTGEVSTVGFIPMLNPSIPQMEFDERPRDEYRGENTRKGDTAMTRYSQKWSGSIEMPFFTEAGTTVGMVGTLLKHFFGDTVGAQNASTGQYYWMMYQVADPFATAALGAKALTFSLNINEGSTMKNWPFVGGRVKSLTFAQEPAQNLKVTAEIFGQFRDTTTAELGSETFAAENLRCDYNNLTVYQGVTRVGTPPDYTDFTFGGATTIKPDSISVKIENGFEDNLRLAGVDYPDKTRVGKSMVEVEMKIDWEDPSSGFSSADDFNSWLNAAGATNLFLYWDTGTQAGTGDNHGLYIDLPSLQRMGGSGPDYDLEKDPMVTLKFKGLVDSTTLYNIGLMLKNTAAAL